MARQNIALGSLLVMALLLFVFDLIWGSIYIPFGEILKIIQAEPSKKSWEYIIVDFRLPKAIAAVTIGGGLSVAGLLMQTMFRNALAGPFVLGINSGASLGVALFVLGGSAFSFSFVSDMGMAVAAIIGASAVLLAVLFVGARVAEAVSLLIIGIMFGSLAGSAVSILQYFSSAENVQRFVVWTFGSLAGIRWEQLALLVPIVCVSMVATLYLAKPLNSLLLGELYAQGLGVNVKRNRIVILLICSFIAGSITAFAGPVAFIGVAVPHIARNIFRCSDHKITIPASALIGICLMLLCDIISQLPGNNTVLPINAVTSFFGAPVVIWVVMRGQRKE